MKRRERRAPAAPGARTSVRSPLPAGALAGLCPKCLLAQGGDTDAGEVRVAVHRLGKRYPQLLRAEIAQTLGDPAQVEEELRSLQAALAG